jgi:FAD/FMN-containing dehydrogenase
MPRALIGSQIMAIGTLKDDNDIEGGGLVVDFREPGSTTVNRIIFAFNECGMWIECQSGVTIPDESLKSLA